jgi:hypothetical protein
MVIVPHPPYSPDFETVSDIQRESQAVLDSIQDNASHIAFEAWKKR